MHNVEQQKDPDGAFPTVKSPNPEEREALQIGIETLLKTNSDILLATDPDTDRVGIAVNHNGKVHLLNGNQIACICLEQICQALTAQNTMPKNAAFIKTIVTTELFKTIAEAYDKPCFDVLTGFKYIAEMIQKWENEGNPYQFIFGGEESYGYLLGTKVRDKDAVIACALLCDVALHAKQQNKTLVDLIHDLYQQYGIYREKLLSVQFPETKEGREQMEKAMVLLRSAPPKEVNKLPITAIEDYQSRTKTCCRSGKTEQITLPASNVLRFWFENGCTLVVRPSGTEPKIKLYGSTQCKEFSNLEDGIKRCDEEVEGVLGAMRRKLMNDD